MHIALMSHTLFAFATQG